MPVGKESVQKRVRKTTGETATVKQTSVAAAPAPKKQTPAEAATASKKQTPVKAATVIGQVSPEVVEKVTGHPEEAKPQVIQVTDDLPYYLL